MIRKEIKSEGHKTVLYIIDGEMNVSEIISELSAMGCNEEELGAAYRKLMSDDKYYTYSNPNTEDAMLVVDDSIFTGNSFVYLIWRFFAMRLWGMSLTDDFLQELKKSRNVIK